MGGIDEIDDPYVSFGGMFPMQAASVLLQCPFPGYRHGQDQSIERGMVKAFPDESSGCEQDPRRVGRQCIEFGDQIRTLLFRHAPM